jgi:hypothetical protein
MYSRRGSISGCSRSVYPPGFQKQGSLYALSPQPHRADALSVRESPLGEKRVESVLVGRFDPLSGLSLY